MGAQTSMEVLKVASEFDLGSFRSEKRVGDYAEYFGLRRLVESRDGERSRQISNSGKELFAPKYPDLCRLHWLVLKRRVLNALEFGSGYSTLVMADAMRILAEAFQGTVVKSEFRTSHLFHVFSVDESKAFLETSRARLGDDLIQRASFYESKVQLTEFRGHFATLYKNLPNISPDFVYLDGPSQGATEDVIDGFSIASPCRMPMSADLLRLEFFLEPGTLIVVDGRTANARFLRKNFQRDWSYLHDEEGDIHIFELQEAPLGRLNQRKIDFCLQGHWLLQG